MHKLCTGMMMSGNLTDVHVHVLHSGYFRVLHHVTSIMSQNDSK